MICFVVLAMFFSSLRVGAQQVGDDASSRGDAASVQAPDSQPAQTLPWGLSVEEFPGLAKYKSQGGIDYYRVYGEEQSPLFPGTPADVAVAFKEEKLCAYLVAINSLKDFDKSLRLMNETYGEPKKKIEGATMIYQWRSGNEKIKLKHNQKTGQMNLGIYYAPVARVIEENQ